MEYKRLGDEIVMRLDVGEDIAEQVLTVAQREKIGFASVSGIGATDAFTVGVFDPAKGTYDRISCTGNHEITALCGSVNRMDGAPYAHLHITCADHTGRVVGGHLLASRISLTGELVLHVADGTVERRPDEALHINRLCF